MAGTRYGRCFTTKSSRPKTPATPRSSRTAPPPMKRRSTSPERQPDERTNPDTRRSPHNTGSRDPGHCQRPCPAAQRSRHGSYLDQDRVTQQRPRPLEGRGDPIVPPSVGTWTPLPRSRFHPGLPAAAARCPGCTGRADRKRPTAEPPGGQPQPVRERIRHRGGFSRRAGPPGRMVRGP